ncbi:hypothetical protein C0989_009934, partial [Termitomyces sp. Mn162]
SRGELDDGGLPCLFMVMDDKSDNSDRAVSRDELDDSGLPPLFIVTDDESDKEVLFDNGNVLRDDSLPSLFIALDAGSNNGTSIAKSADNVLANIIYICIADQPAGEIPPSSFYQDYH